MTQSISVCMIVRNEADLLAATLDNAWELANDVVVVDTGSTDNTVEIALNTGAQVVEDVDRMHKGNARNIAMDMAPSDWIVILDADEKIADPDGVRSFLQNTDADAVYVKLAYVDDAGIHALSFSQMRMWRRGTYQYRYRAHEIPIPVNGQGKQVYTDFVWEHRPPSDRGWKLQYTLDRLLLDVEEYPNGPRPLFYLGRQYAYMAQWDKGIQTLKKFLSALAGHRERPDAWLYLARCYGGLGNREEQKAALFRACQEAPKRREFWGVLAEMYREDDQQALAAGLLKTAMGMPAPSGTYIDQKWYSAYIHDLLARCHWKLGQYEEGREQAKIAVQKSPHDQHLMDNLGYFERKLNEECDLNWESLGAHRGNGLKVLVVAYQDYGGVAQRIARALRESDCRVRAVTYRADYLGYPKDVFRPTDDEFADLLDWAKIVHVFDFVPQTAKGWGKPIVTTYSGSYYRTNYKLINSSYRSLGVGAQLCTSIDLVQYGPEWMPIPIWNQSAETRNGISGAIRVIQCPTNRQIKRTDEVIANLADVPGVELEIVEGLSNKACLERKKRAHVLIDQFDLGYGLNALEAWAMGLPVIASASPEISDRIKKVVGYLPYVQASLDELLDAVMRLRDDPDFYLSACDRGREYVATWHEPRQIAKQLTDQYEQLIDGDVGCGVS